MSVPSWAGEGDWYVGVGAGFLFNSTLNTQVTLEKELRNRNAMAFFMEAGDKWHRDPVCGKVCRDVFWDYYYWGGGVEYKWALTQGRNSALRLVAGAELGSYRRDIFTAAEANFEWFYSFYNGIQLSITQKNQFSLLNGDMFRNGLLIGIKIPF